MLIFQSNNEIEFILEVFPLIKEHFEWSLYELYNVRHIHCRGTRYTATGSEHIFSLSSLIA